jgi:tRNA uridine 5-carboxymethylaminomethyl modification enzyme
VTVSRAEGYTGILIDDLVTKGADEPYRMFTSRAEFRLHLRIDNADERLTPIAHRVGLASAERWELLLAKQRHKARLLDAMRQTRAGPELVGVAANDRPVILEWLKRPEAHISRLTGWARQCLGEEPARGVLTTIETEVKYAGYMAQQERQIERLRTSERQRIPEEFSFSEIPGLSREVREKLDRVRPQTLGQAARIPGVTPAAIAVLHVYLSLGTQK